MGQRIAAEGKALLIRRLMQAGIARSAIDDIKEEISEDCDTIIMLVDEKLMPDLRKQITLDSFDAKNWMDRSFRFLLSRGYSSSLAIEILKKRIREVE